MKSSLRLSFVSGLFLALMASMIGPGEAWAHVGAPYPVLMEEPVGPYLLSGKSILTTSRIKSVVKDSSDFNDPEIRLVALKNSTSESFVQRQMPEASLHAIANYNEGIQMLLTGSVDAMVADVPILKLSMLRYPDAGMGIVEPQLSVEPLGIALAMGDIQFENLLRNYLLAFDKAGLIPRLQQKWLEDNSWMVYLP
jgi:ABC-type amino acid transport substrate-binding protein